MRTPRRLTVMVCLDVTGFTRLVHEDERAILVELASIRRDLIDATVEHRNGHIFKTTGDGVLIEFTNIEDAVSWALEFQEAMAARNQRRPGEPILVRAGIALADVYIAGEDRLGAAVAFVVRLQEVAPPGGIAMTHSVRWQLGKALVARFTRVMKTLKSIDEPMEIWLWSPSGMADGDAPTAGLGVDGIAAIPMSTVPDDDGSATRAFARPALALPDKPSIAVLPFKNMSGDSEQEYFADGVVEEIITALSRMRWLFVIARNSSFTYKNRAVDVKQVGRELGVRYVLEGSVRKSGNRVRITGQLIDAATNAHLWADRFDGGLEDIFDLQDQVTASVVGAIAPKLEQAEIERAKRKPTESLDAYDYFLRGMAEVHQWTREANKEALQFLYRAIELDPTFASAYGMAARCYAQRKACGWVTDRAQENAEAARLARRAAEFGKEDAVALCTAGIAIAYVVGDLDNGEALTDRALVLNPNLAWAWLFSGWVKIWLGEPEVAIERAARAMRLSPYDPQISTMQAAVALGHFLAGRHAEALRWAEISMREQQGLVLPMCVAAASGAFAGQLRNAEKVLALLRQAEPALHMSNLGDFFPFRRSEDMAKWGEGLRQAGLPE